ncbi:MAG: hypothetical protein A3I07_00650 [Candidatus Doudnabacteria bacterium RIFCSPLOWO2_02_FULL_42_9]|uniref:DUF5671 domain-containing protein n=1 Tax=Candidatus Doudnabacteria bacterium RIFCSPHIGHO2_01_FULL_41_86 TaxID=1817821 RepID=A0A1F5N9N7_9BACT|nr:MAG: hypothetical protein A2717_02660 [Candidatus Doudnabacteria bacterium RIFCSPHIGHO2_01_FULL_41_86]OGE75493.1 MAG: hypothetical protein A3K07_00990 [Candidatus Doudnabacteria bacterium RIFCSPHIGHO2_01_43_10]OGE85450.1 MAG: hypothetical protein A3E28_02230 [Candidatus Doudnabacteria bacterium RIFCSPHIGHO2_12_FULL_42_22]OGE86988.1 MAG: hypothetical protein A3C49_03065 [Candidatus Doudnabacteria bacterium RIFCSPHIGHO2_02_FULL_42_25]OGE92587.1 MAG: hypothetical protein A2895_03220 [Candidatus
MDNIELKNYVDNARKQGMTDEQIRQNLAMAGWAEHDINQTLTPAPVASMGVTVPTPSHTASTDYHVNMWIVFQYILMFITLATSAISLSGIGHHFIDENLGMESGSSYASYFGNSLILGYVASLIVAFPVFAALFIILRRKIEIEPAIRNIKSRKFFIYVALLWTFIVLVVRVIGLVYGFLSGSEYAGASFAHLLVTFATAGSIFTYFILDVRKKG